MMPLLHPSARYIIPDLPSADELLPFLRQIDRNLWYSNFGPLNNKFEADFTATMQRAHGDKKPLYAVTLVSCYHALAIGLKLLGVEAGDKVLVPSITFPACPLAVQHIGAEPILADVDNQSWALTPTIAKNISQKIKLAAVMPVAVYGAPLDAKAWDDFYIETGIPVIIDAAAAIESQHYPKFGLVTHSLHALKPFGIGEGGLLIGRNKKLIQAAREYSNFGTRMRITYNIGENAKLSEYHAAVALAQLKRWPKIKQNRKKILDKYKKIIKQNGLSAEIYSGLERAIVSCLMLRLDKPMPRNFIEKMKKQNVHLHRTYLPPLYHHPHFDNLQVANAEGKTAKKTGPSGKKDLMITAESLNQTVIGLPFHAFLEDLEIEQIVRSLALMI